MTRSIRSDARTTDIGTKNSEQKRMDRRLFLATAKGTDPAVMKVLHNAFKKGLEDPDHVASLAKFEQEVIYMSPEEYRKFALATFEKEKTLVETIKKREANR